MCNMKNTRKDTIFHLASAKGGKSSAFQANIHYAYPSIASIIHAVN